MESNFYPTISIKKIKNPSRFYATPILGFLVKLIMLIPVFIELVFLFIGWFIFTLVNSFSVLFSGKYMKSAYDVSIGLIRLSLKVNYFIFGLTDKYPGFSLDIKDNFKLNMKYPTKPNRLFAFPFFGGLARIILLIPYTIYSGVIGGGAWIGVVVTSFPVLFSRKYPDSTFELARDSKRVSSAVIAYYSGLSDQYPSFKISMNHKSTKIILIVLGALFYLIRYLI